MYILGELLVSYEDRRLLETGTEIKTRLLKVGI